MAVILATAGPFIYLYLQRKAEERLLEEEFQVRSLLMRASYGMTSIRQLPKLQKFILSVLTSTLRIRHAAIYLRDADTQNYVLGQAQSSQIHYPDISPDDPIPLQLTKNKYPLVLEEIRMQHEASPQDVSVTEIFRQMNQMSARVIIPAIAQKMLIGFVVLGERKDREFYSSDLVSVLSALGNQAALAIENCVFLEAETQRIKNEGARARRESLDMLVSTMAHEIDNPIASIMGNADFLDMVLEDHKESLPPKALQMMQDSLGHIMRDSKRVSAINRSIEEYSKGGAGLIEPASLEPVLEGYHHILSLISKKFSHVNYQEEIAPELPDVMGEKIMLEEILVNFAENAFHAVFKKEKDRNVMLKIFLKDSRCVRMEMHDNGYGIPEAVRGQLFEVPTTTKGSAEGTGLGLFRVRQVCEIVGAAYGVDSGGKDSGSTFWVELAVSQT